MSGGAEFYVEPEMPSQLCGLEDLTAFMNRVHQTAVEHGWWETDGNIGEKFMLMVTELSEAFEHYREHRGLQEIFLNEDGKPDGIPVELADVIIRLLDFCGRHQIPIVRALIMKANYNDKRSYRHGNKAA